MTRRFRPFRRCCLLLALLGPLAATAHEGHDHGAPANESPTAAEGPLLVAVGDEFEVVGVLDADGLTLYLDDTRSNQAIDQAKLEIEGDKLRGVALRQAAGTYRLPLKAPLSTGKHALTISVVAGERSDLLSGTLEIAALRPTAKAEAAAGSRQRGLTFGIGGLALAVISLLAWRRFKRPLSRRRGAPT
jgi:hypothetical protein